jgi:sulfur carrier protein
MTTVQFASEDLSLTVNGEPRTVARGSTVADLLHGLRLDPRQVVVEHNREIVHGTPPGDSLSSRLLSAGDVVEIVHFVGGG